MRKKQRAIVLASGGCDSTTLLYWAKERYEEVIALCINYGQRHNQELACVYYHAEKLGIPVLCQALPSAIFGEKNSLTNANIPVSEGAYEQQVTQGTINTEVPFRNGVFLSIAAAIAMSLDGGDILCGVHSDDSGQGIYSDCNPVFIDALGYAILLGTRGTVTVYAPFATYYKAGVIAIGKRLGLTREDYEQHTWSCYCGEAEPCGKCGTCIDKQKALDEVYGVGDEEV